MMNLPAERVRKSYRDEVMLGFGHEAQKHRKEQNCRQRAKTAPSSPPLTVSSRQAGSLSALRGLLHPGAYSHGNLGAPVLEAPGPMRGCHTPQSLRLMPKGLWTPSFLT